MLRVIVEFDRAVENAGVDLSDVESAAVREAVTAFADEYDKLRAMLDGLADRAAENLTRAYADLEQDARFVTIMLFGRTRAGKSTTMEALTAGDGESIGFGGQHTTKEVRAYFFPREPDGGVPPGPSLRIVDTPGIEGFEGDDLAAMAEHFVERADHILFLLTDDKATATELERFGLIRTQGKSVTVLLNVKAADDDLDLLVESPAHVFRQDELDGHQRRISGYLKRHFDMPPPEIIPYHARAAWLGRSIAELPVEVEDRRRLETESRIGHVEERVVRFITEEAVPARLRAPADLLNSYLWSLKDELRPFAGRFREMMHSMDEIAEGLTRGAEKARRRVAHRFALLRGRFQAASDGIPGIVDEVIAGRGDGLALDSRWTQLLGDHGVSDSVTWFVEVGQHDFESELAEEVRVAAADFSTSKADGLDDLLDGYHKNQDQAKRNKFGRAALRAGAGTGAAALTGWAIANWWNPTGWAAGAAAALVVATGLGAESIARSATDEWERTTKRELFSQRAEIIATLRERLWVDYRHARARCGDWLDKTKAIYLTTAAETAAPVRRSSAALWRSTVAALDGLDDVADSLDHQLMVELLAALIPEFERGDVVVERVARQPGYAAKVLVGGHNGVNAMAVSIGRGGSRIKAARQALGGERIDLVDASAATEMQVLQALGRAHLPTRLVTVELRPDGGTAQVALTGRSAACAVGPSGVNVRLASKILEIEIEIGDRR